MLLQLDKAACTIRLCADIFQEAGCISKFRQQTVEQLCSKSRLANASLAPESQNLSRCIHAVGAVRNPGVKTLW